MYLEIYILFIFFEISLLSKVHMNISLLYNLSNNKLSDTTLYINSAFWIFFEELINNFLFKSLNFKLTSLLTPFFILYFPLFNLYALNKSFSSIVVKVTSFSLLVKIFSSIYSGKSKYFSSNIYDTTPNKTSIDCNAIFCLESSCLILLTL